MTVFNNIHSIVIILSVSFVLNVILAILLIRYVRLVNKFFKSVFNLKIKL